MAKYTLRSYKKYLKDIDRDINKGKRKKDDEDKDKKYKWGGRRKTYKKGKKGNSRKKYYR